MSNPQLKRHFKLKHDTNQSEKLKCDKCDYETPHSNYMKSHAYKHGKQKPYHCDQCEKSYRTMSELNLHKVNAHTERNAFPCKSCSKEFKTAKGLNYHVTNEHSSTNENEIEWFECDICDEYKSKQKDLLYIHKKIHKTDNEIECEICGIKLVKTEVKQHMKYVHCS